MNIEISIKKRNNKQKVTFSVNKDTLQEFNELAKKLKINKSNFIEKCLKQFIAQAK
jgi:metal-responsive CopG/Arc/MetJ family transcriptional regulator